MIYYSRYYILPRVKNENRPIAGEKIDEELIRKHRIILRGSIFFSQMKIRSKNNYPETVQLNRIDLLRLYTL